MLSHNRVFDRNKLFFDVKFNSHTYAVYSACTLQGKETVLFSYDQHKPGADVIWQCLGDPQVSDKHAFVGEGWDLA